MMSRTGTFLAHDDDAVTAVRLPYRASERIAAHAGVEREPLAVGGARDHRSRAARARSRAAPSPRHALPCMQASVVGFSAASRSSMPRAFRVCEK